MEFGGYITFLLVGTALFGVAGLAFGEGNPFDCNNSNDCTIAAVQDIQDFDLTDILDILQFIFILLGDVLELFASLNGLINPPISTLVTLLFVVGWGIAIVLFALEALPG